MRIQLFRVLAVSALLAPTAAAQAPDSPPAVPAQFPAAAEPVRPLLSAPPEDKAPAWLSQIGLRWRAPVSETEPAPAAPEMPRVRSPLWVTNELLTWWVHGMLMS